MIIIRILEDNAGDEVEQEIYCNDPCYPNFKGYLVDFNLYSDEVVDHEKYLGHYPLIAEAFISTDYEEYCIDCEKQLNIFDEDIQRFRPRTEADNEIIKSVNFKGQSINFKRLF